MAVDVDDRKLRPRHRMLRHDQRRLRLVFGDFGWREFRLAGPGRAEDDLAGALRLLRRDGRKRRRDEDRKNDLRSKVPAACWKHRHSMAVQ